jgi:superfamily II DNA or RNA helicase
MSTRDRAWLRTFLFLGSRAERDATVLGRDVERQEDTVLRALELLDEQPGVVLADEVGMGKTYEALGVLAARLHEGPARRALILTPGPDLNTKWRKELTAFCDAQRPMYRGFANKFAEATNLAQLIGVAKTTQIVIAPVSIFAGSRSQADQAYLISLWASAQDLAGNQVAALLRRYGDGSLERVKLESAAFLGHCEWSEIKKHVSAVLAEHKRELGDASLHVLFKANDYEAFSDKRTIDHALADLRFRLVGRLLPDIDLLIVDEAHKLKNADSVRATGVRVAFGGRFDKALFLTATPFQLSVHELREVFSLFGRARTAPADLDEQANLLLDDVREYTSAYDEFERLWSQLDGAGVGDFERWFTEDQTLASEPKDPILAALAEPARRLLFLKRERIEKGFRKWMIRSLREDKRVYRRPVRTRLRPEAGHGVPFLLYERFIAELFRSKSRTHKAAVQINMVSSYGAARAGALLNDEVKAGLAEEPESYRKLLKRIVSGDHEGHPKVEHVVHTALTAAAEGEKTLIFCARVETLHELKRRIEAAWNERMVERWAAIYPGATADDIFDRVADDDERTRGRHSRLQQRFQRGIDALYLALRERYVPTLLEASDFAEENRADIVRRANELLGSQRVTKTHAERKDWSLVKRCVEHATALALRDSGSASDVDPEVLRRLTDPTFITLGYDLEADDVESASPGTHVPSWTIDEDDATLVMSKLHLWSHLKAPLFDIPAALRVRTVERLAAYLVSRFVPFLPDLLAYASEQGVDVNSVESRVLLPVVDRFWTTTKGSPWCELVRRFLVYAGQQPEERRKEVLDDVVRAGAIVRHTVDGESRERLREAFNTPLYPMVLVANEVMQEGLDLHHHCRRVVHHDLAWNPAQLEQRVGRVDRLGSLVQRMRMKAPSTTLDISLPLVANTIDERLERTVRHRERWLEFLLGAPPRIEEYGLADDPPLPLPPAFAEALRVDLGPTGALT